MSATVSENWAGMLNNKRYWGVYFVTVVAIVVAGIGYMTGAAHFEIPPLCNFEDPDGKVIISANMIKHGEEVFHTRGLMSYGTYLGDGSERGPDYTAEALHIMAVSMGKHYEETVIRKNPGAMGAADWEAMITARVRWELRNNTYDDKRDVVVLNAALVRAWEDVEIHYRRTYQEPGYTDLHPVEIKHFSGATADVRDLAAFFFWGGWLCAAARPGEEYSYTHNWPYDPLVGNLPTPEVMLWSAISIGVLFVGRGLTLYVYGQAAEAPAAEAQLLTTQDLENDVVRPTQRATYKFFMLAMLAFAIQTFAGVACAIDFVRPFGFSFCSLLPFTVFRSYHAVFQIFWFFVAWVGTTIFFLPRFSPVPVLQEFLIELLFVGCSLVAVGGVIGIPLGQMGFLHGDAAYYFGSQGWEFMELGRFFQDLLLAGFVLWITIMARGVFPYLTWKNVWSPPAWLLYGSMVMVMFLFFSLKVTPKTNFIISDFWRWMVVHMWVEVTFEVFTTVIVAFLYTEMGLISVKQAESATYIAVMLFFLTATIGVGHNFYWIAKPTAVIALGSTFSTTQVLPLLLLTLDAWKMAQESAHAEALQSLGNQKYVMKEVWLFLLGVNFWNIWGAGVLGSFVNLPIINYFEHATYVTGNHAHAAMFGVKGNVALAGMLFCVQHLMTKECWSPKFVRGSFWCLNGGIALMMFLSLFPCGMYQMFMNFKYGFWYARSQDVREGAMFQALLKGRAIGGHVFIWGGMMPLVYFVIQGMCFRKPCTPIMEADNKYRSTWFVEKAHAE
jgi:nitric oxide reductase subunit B